MALLYKDSNTLMYYIHWERKAWDEDGDESVWTPHVTTDVSDIHVCKDCGQPLTPRNSSRDNWDWVDIDAMWDVDITDGFRCYSCAGDDEKSLYGKTDEMFGTDKLPGEVYQELGKVQKAVLCAMDDLVYPQPYHTLEAAYSPGTDASEHPKWCNRTRVSRIAGERYYEYSSPNAATSAISRAVSSLLERGLIYGAFKGWVTYYGDPGTNPMYQGRYFREGAIDQHGPTPDGSRSKPERHGDDESVQTRRPTLELLGFRYLGRETAALIKVVDEIAEGEPE